VFVTSPRLVATADFQRAVERGNLLAAESAARELESVSLADALELLLLIAATEPTRFERAAIRWLGRFCIETRGVDIADAQLLLGAVAGLNDIALRVQLETIALVAERYKVSSVAQVARRRLNRR
jgi:hypothetical protein